MLPPVGRSNHPVVLCAPALGAAYVAPKVKYIWAQKQGPLQKDAFLTALSEIRWEPLYRADSYEDQFNMFQSTIADLMDTHLPVRQKRHCSNDHACVTDQFRDLVQRRQRALLSGSLALYSFYRSRVNRASKYLRRAHYNQLVVSLETNSG